MSLAERVELSLQNINEFGDGKTAICFALELKRALLDCLNRPTEGKARKVTLEMLVTPVEHEGSCEGVNLATNIKSTIPQRQTNPIRLGITMAGQAWFLRESDEEADEKSKSAGEE